MSAVATWICPSCGGTAKHYNTATGHFVCSSCGTEIISPEEERKKIHYLNTVQKAKDNLRVGNWDTSKQLVYPLLNDYPCDKTLYLILMAAITKGYEDYLFDSTLAQKQEAANVWNKLSRLDSINATMIDYARKKDLIAQSRWEALKKKVLLLIAGVVFAILLAVAISSALSTLVMLAIMVVLGRTIYQLNPISTFKAKYEYDKRTHENPFE